MNNFLLTNVKLTRLKIAIAKKIYLVVHLFYKDKQIITRNGIIFEIDLREGIDLHLFLFGNFQKHIIENKVVEINDNAVIFDIGANAGVMSLFFSQKAPGGFVHAFEPTTYAYNKLHRNLELNPLLAKRITVTQCFISSTSSESSDLKAFSSWPLDSSEDKHAIHGGVVKSTDGIPSITIDDYCESHSIDKIDFVKIDTDGHEYEVLSGMKETLRQFKPPVIFEIGLYIMDEHNISFSHYGNFFSALDYRIFSTNGHKIDLKNYKNHIPNYGTVDLIAVPR